MQQASDRLRVIKLILLGQFLAMLVAGACGLLVGQMLGQMVSDAMVVGWSALLGGFIAWMPNLYFALRAFRYRGARAAQKIVSSFYAGAFGKMILTMGLFAIVFIKVKPLSALALFAGFIAVQTMSWIVPLAIAMLDRQRYTQ